MFCPKNFKYFWGRPGKKRSGTTGTQCRKDLEVIDETPAAYQPIGAVMEAQQDLVAIVPTLHQAVCVKG